MEKGLGGNLARLIDGGAAFCRDYRKDKCYRRDCSYRHVSKEEFAELISRAFLSMRKKKKETREEIKNQSPENTSFMLSACQRVVNW